MNNTGNAVPSTSPLDLQDNAITLDQLINGDAIEVTSRTGKKLKGIAALQSIITSLDLGSFTFPDIASGLAGTTSGQYFRVPQGKGDELSFIYYMHSSDGTASIVATMPSSASIESVRDLIYTVTSSSSDNYLALPDASGLLSPNRITGKEEGAFFGTRDNNLSNEGLSTSVVSLGVSSRDESIILEDAFGMVKYLVSQDGSEETATNKISRELILSSLEEISSLSELWQFSAENMLTGFVKNKVLLDKGGVVQWPLGLVAIPKQSYLQCNSVSETLSYCMKVVVQLPKFPADSTENYRSVLYSFDDRNKNFGNRLLLQKDTQGNYCISAFRPQLGFIYDGVVLPPEFKEGDWICIHHVVSLSNNGDNHQCIFFGGTYNKLVEFDNCPLLASSLPLNIGASDAIYSTSNTYKYSGVEGIFAEISFYSSALTESQLRQSHQFTSSRLALLGISLKEF